MIVSLKHDADHDAVKRALPKDAPQPGKFRLGNGQGEAANLDAAPQEEKKED